MRLHSKAFTLIEFIFVVLILGILSAAAYPKLSKMDSNTMVQISNKPATVAPSNTTEW